MGTTVNLLGLPKIITDGHSLELPPGKSSALLYYLAHQSTWVARDDLVYLFWPDHEETKGRSNLRQLLTSIRRHEHLEGIEIERSRVRWQVPTDLHAFHTAITHQQPEEAVNSYLGPLLDGFRLLDAPEFESWLELERDILEEQWRSATLKHAGTLQEDGCFEEAVSLLEHLMKTDPLDEQTFRALLTALAKNGRRTESLARYTSFKEQLRDELGVEPDPETQQLVQALREEAPKKAPPQARAQPAQSPSRQGLLRPTTAFIGRQGELNLLQDYLRQPDGHLVTLLAQGGMGKTRLALETAHRLRNTYPHGAHFIPLANTTVIEGVAPTMAETLGIDLISGQEPLPQVLVALREWEALLVLDNLEQLPGMNKVVQELLAVAPGLRILATSRARLNLTAERIIELHGLPYPTSPASENFEAFEAINLFASRARRLDPTFDLVKQAHLITRICALTAGMPLALEFAAAWLRVLPLPDIVTELKRGLDLLEATEADVNERHTSIRHVFQASWELLSRHEQEALLKLSVFRGGFTREAAREAADVGLPLLLTLRNKSFLEMDASGRFAQHPLVEVFVREKAESCAMDLEQTRRCHAEHLFAFLEQQEAFRHTAERDKAFTEITRERGNIQAAWQWAAHGRREDLFARLGPMIAASFKASGYDDELTKLTEFALTRIPEGSRGWARLVLTSFGLLDDMAQLPHNEEGYELLHRASEALQRHGDERGTARSLIWLGVSAAYLNRNDEARQWWQQARKLYTQLGDQARLGVILENLMVSTLDPVERERLHHEAYSLYEQSGAVREQPGLLRNHVLFITRTYGQYDQARKLLEQALALGGQGDPFLNSHILSDGSTVALDQGHLISAKAQAHEALELTKPFNNRPAERCRKLAWIRLAWVALAEGNIETATEIAERNHDTELQVRLALLRKNPEEAHRLLYEEGLDQMWKQAFAPREVHWQRTQALLLAADVEIARGNPNEAWQHLEGAVTLACEQVFVPSALEAFVVAAPLLPRDKAEELLAMAATHPAASFDIQQRARRLMSADPTAMDPSTLTTEGVLERALALRKS